MNWLVFIVADLDPELVARLGAVADDHLPGLSTFTLVAIEILIDAHRTWQTPCRCCCVRSLQSAIANGIGAERRRPSGWHRWF